jgi:hypothetical protein
VKSFKCVSKFRCCNITVDSATTALQNDACTFQCILNKCTIKHPFHTKTT